jgi:hypothetical protein
VGLLHRGRTPLRTVCAAPSSFATHVAVARWLAKGGAGTCNGFRISRPNRVHAGDRPSGLPGAAQSLGELAPAVALPLRYPHSRCRADRPFCRGMGPSAEATIPPFPRPRMHLSNLIDPSCGSAVPTSFASPGPHPRVGNGGLALRLTFGFIPQPSMPLSETKRTVNATSGGCAERLTCGHSIDASSIPPSPDGAGPLLVRTFRGAQGIPPPTRVLQVNG